MATLVEERWPVLAPSLIAAGLIAVETLVYVSEVTERRKTYEVAKAIADHQQKPLLNVGCPASRPLAYPCGDVCVDISEFRLKPCQATWSVFGDVRNMPFQDNAFAAVTCFHVLEHMMSVSDAQKALKELQRVAAYVFVCSPKRANLYARLQPDHYLWVDHGADGQLAFEQRPRGQWGRRQGFKSLIMPGR